MSQTDEGLRRSESIPKLNSSMESLSFGSIQACEYCKKAKLAEKEPVQEVLVGHTCYLSSAASGTARQRQRLEREVAVGC